MQQRPLSRSGLAVSRLALGTMTWGRDTDGEDAATLLRKADAAMYQAKEKGRNNYQFFTESILESAARRLAIERRLGEAFEQRQLKIFYQPQVQTGTGTVVGVEALLHSNRSSPTGPTWSIMTVRPATVMDPSR